MKVYLVESCYWRSANVTFAEYTVEYVSATFEGAKKWTMENLEKFGRNRDSRAWFFLVFSADLDTESFEFILRINADGTTKDLGAIDEPPKTLNSC